MKGISRERFDKTMDALFRTSMPSKVCVAVSGGVDSMALTFLTCQYFLPKQVQVTGLVVNHDLRAESSKEANDVTRLVKKFGAGSRVLKMKWTRQEKENMARFEVEAREKRLSLLHEACRYRSGVEHLLFAHTLDDQLETLLLRLTRGSSIRGLAGMKENSTYWGTAMPGERPLQLVRPLLNYTKEELYNTCIENNVKWFEDSTNHDPEFTIRNSIRQFLKDPKALPHAFQRESLERSLKIFQAKREEAEVEAEDVVEMLVKTGGAHLDERKARVQFNEFEGFDLVTPSTLALALQRLVARIIPTEDTGYRFSQFEKIASRMQAIPRRPNFDFEETKTKTVKFSSLSLDWRMTPIGHSHIPGGPKTTIYKWTIQRQLPYKQEHAYSVVFRATTEWSTWKLFDNRYWVRVRTTTTAATTATTTQVPENQSQPNFLTVVIKYPSFRVNDLTFMKRFLTQSDLGCTSPYDVLIQPCVFLACRTNMPAKTGVKGYIIEKDEQDFKVVGCPSLGQFDLRQEQNHIQVECLLKQDPNLSPSIPTIKAF